jgi:hypothetical protein
VRLPVELEDVSKIERAIPSADDAHRDFDPLETQTEGAWIGTDEIGNRARRKRGARNSVDPFLLDANPIDGGGSHFERWALIGCPGTDLNERFITWFDLSGI